eukprot:6180276-Pleurochrysis_carterae.AAC.3
MQAICKSTILADDIVILRSNLCSHFYDGRFRHLVCRLYPDEKRPGTASTATSLSIGGRSAGRSRSRALTHSPDG